MVRGIDYILKNAEAELAKKANFGKEASLNLCDSEIENLIGHLKQASQEKVATEFTFDQNSDNQETVEKLAHCAALFETAQNIQFFSKISEFEKVASSKGFSADRINATIEKLAAERGISFGSLLFGQGV